MLVQHVDVAAAYTLFAFGGAAFVLLLFLPLSLLLLVRFYPAVVSTVATVAYGCR